MRDRILDDLKNAMKNQNKEVLSVVRMIKGAMQLEEINLKRELSDSEMLSLISKQIKTRKESLVDFEKANRIDLISSVNKEIEILSSYLPKQLTDEEIKEEIKKIFYEIKPTSMQEMGKVMAKAKDTLNGKADLSYVSKLIKEEIEKI